MNLFDQEGFPLIADRLVEMSNQMLMTCRLETRLYIDFIGPLVPGVAKIGLALILEMIKCELENVIINATGCTYLLRQMSGHLPERISVGHGAADQDDFFVGQEICVAKRQEAIPVSAVETDHGFAVVRRRVGEFSPEQIIYEKRPVTNRSDQQFFERAG